MLRINEARGQIGAQMVVGRRADGMLGRPNARRVQAPPGVSLWVVQCWDSDRCSIETLVSQSVTRAISDGVGVLDLVAVTGAPELRWIHALESAITIPGSPAIGAQRRRPMLGLIVPASQVQDVAAAAARVASTGAVIRAFDRAPPAVAWAALEASIRRLSERAGARRT